MNYEQLTMNYANKNKANTKPIKAKTNPIQTQNKPNTNPKQTQFQTRSEAEIPTGGLLGILKPGTNFKGKKMTRHGYFALF